MARIDSLRAKISKYASKGKLDGLIKLSNDPDDDVRTDPAHARPFTYG